MALDNMLVLPHRRKRRTQQQEGQRRSPETPPRRLLVLALLLLLRSRSAPTVTSSFTSPVASPVPPRQELSRRRRQQLQGSRTAVRSSSSLRLHFKSPPASPARASEGEILLRRRRRLLILSMRNAGTGNDAEFLGYDDHRRNRDDDSAYGGAAGDGSSNDADFDPYHDRRPRRRTVLGTAADEMRAHRPIHPRHGPQWTWNVHHPSTKLLPAFPGTVDELSDDIVEALETAWTHSRSTGSVWGSDGRVGIEIDGASSLQLVRPSGRLTTTTMWSSDGHALRTVALQVAIKLSKCNRHTASASLNCHRRPVAVYLNTIQQSLRANGELRCLLMSLEVNSDHYDRNCGDPTTSTATTSISLHCLTQDPALPSSMMEWNRNPNTKKKKRRKSSASPSAPFPEVDSTRGVVIVVQPSDYNHEHRPPGPTLGAAEALQKLCARAALEGVPVVVLSPRFGRSSTWRPSDDESLSFMDPTSQAMAGSAAALPWILRDFVPPVYSWVAWNPSSSSGMVMKGVVEHPRRPPPTHAKTETMLDNDEDASSRRWNPTLTWHMFASQHDRGAPRRRPSASESASSAPRMRHRYTYLASASYVPVAAAGPSFSRPATLSTLPAPPPPHRPPSSLLQRVWEEFGTVVLVNR